MQFYIYNFFCIRTICISCWFLDYLKDVNISHMRNNTYVLVLVEIYILHIMVVLSCCLKVFPICPWTKKGSNSFWCLVDLLCVYTCIYEYSNMNQSSKLCKWWGTRLESGEILRQHKWILGSLQIRSVNWYFYRASRKKCWQLITKY